MNELMSSTESHDTQAFAALSEKLRVSPNDVVKVYEEEFTRLHAQARVKTYVGVLAMSNTKDILHKTASRRC
jgi:nanoRNase/pAp phosphatase (c-di-AMP/oligoRNAs hydrolase)